MAWIKIPIPLAPFGWPNSMSSSKIFPTKFQFTNWLVLHVIFKCNSSHSFIPILVLHVIHSKWWLYISFIVVGSILVFCVAGVNVGFSVWRYVWKLYQFIWFVWKFVNRCVCLWEFNQNAICFRNEIASNLLQIKLFPCEL